MEGLESPRENHVQNVNLEDLLSFKVDYGKIQFVFKSVLDELKQNNALIQRLQVEKRQLKERSNDHEKHLMKIDEILETKADKDELVPLATRIYSLESTSPLPSTGEGKIRAASIAQATVPQSAGYDESILDDYMANHERRLRNLEETLTAGILGDEEADLTRANSQGSAASGASKDSTVAGSGHAAVRSPKSKNRKGSNSSMDSTKDALGSARSVQSKTSSTGSRGKPVKKEGAEVRKTASSVVTEPKDSYTVVPKNYENEEHLLRSGLPSRLRGLMDDHEKRLKQLEGGSQSASRPSSGTRVSLAQQVNDQADDLKGLQDKVADLASMIIALGESDAGKVNPAFKEAAKEINNSQMQEMQEKLNQLQASGADVSALQGELKNLTQKVSAIEMQTENLSENMERVKHNTKNVGSVSDSLSRVQNDVKLVGLRVQSLEDISNAQISTGSGGRIGTSTGAGGGMGTTGADVVGIRLKALQDSVDMIVEAQNTLEQTSSDVGRRVEDVEQNASELQRRITGMTNDMKDGLAEGITVDVFRGALREIRDSLSGLESRMRREEQNVKLMNTKVNTLSAKADSSAGFGHSRSSSWVSKQLLEKSMGGGGGTASGPDINELRTALTSLAQVVDDHSMHVQMLIDEKLDKTLHDELKSNVNDAHERINMLQERLTNFKADGAIPLTPGGSNKSNPKQQRVSDNALIDITELKGLVQSHASSIDRLFADKANRETIVQHSQQLEEIRKALGMRTGKFGKGIDLDFIQELSKIVNTNKESLTKMTTTKADKQITADNFTRLNEGIENLHLNKADATAVASKAERDYVENALEKLRREVEQVMNNTNNGLIETLDKSLNILRDMIEGKANVTDMLKLREVITTDKKDNDTPEGLAGYKQFRCLSCNRKMEGMRGRPLGMNFMNFMTHLPNPRTKALYQQTQAHRRIGSANTTRSIPHSAPTGGRITATAATTTQDDHILPPLPLEDGSGAQQPLTISDRG